MKKAKYLNYPQNLIPIITKPVEYPKLLNDSISEEEVVDIMKEVLTDREYLLIQYRYKTGKTLEECGKIYGITKERIRQIEKRAFRKIRFRVYRSQLKRYHEELLSEYEALIRKISDVERELGFCKPEEVLTVDNLPIDSLDLSVRSHNALKREGVETIGQLKDMSVHDVHMIRNIGNISENEIITKLKEKFNIELKGV